MHAVAPLSEAYKPAVHAAHDVIDEAPAKVPAEQREHTVDVAAPITAEYVPTPHGMQLLD